MIADAICHDPILARGRAWLQHGPFPPEGAGSRFWREAGSAPAISNMQAMVAIQIRMGMTHFLFMSTNLLH
jgi:hypothetical protein